jgi:hypothetical protein
MNISEKQLEANRRNAIMSTGPRTDAGMAVTSKNALKHGLLSAEVVIPGEDPAEFSDFRKTMLDDLFPIGQLELMLADRIIGSFWKLRRSGKMENELYVSLMDPGYSEDIITKEKPYEIILGCTNPDGSKYVGSHYSVSKTDGVKDLLAEPEIKKAETVEPKDSVRSLGSMALQDFTSSNILSRFRRYEGQIERSLYKALTELHRLQWLRNRNDLEI